MDEQPEKRIDLNSELGMSRRDLIRRGAVVGGTLLWVAPAIQSMAPKAFAQETNPGSKLCSACADVFHNGVFVGHQEFDPTPDCCNCLDANNGNVLLCPSPTCKPTVFVAGVHCP